MSLFVCECGNVENTALGERQTANGACGTFGGRYRVIRRCSRCATGKWHDVFPEEKWLGPWENDEVGNIRRPIKMCTACGKPLDASHLDDGD